MNALVCESVGLVPKSISRTCFLPLFLIRFPDKHQRPIIIALLRDFFLLQINFYSSADLSCLLAGLEIKGCRLKWIFEPNKWKKESFSSLFKKPISSFLEKYFFSCPNHQADFRHFCICWRKFRLSTAWLLPSLIVRINFTNFSHHFPFISLAFPETFFDNLIFVSHKMR